MLASVPEWIAAIGTVLAAVVAVGIAIGLQWWQARSGRNRLPRLSLKRDDASWLQSRGDWPKIRLTVENETGRTAAHDVLVSVEGIREGGGSVVHHPLDMTLPWSQLYEARLVPMTIPAGARRHVDLGEFVDNSDPTPSRLQPSPWPLGQGERPVYS